VEEGQLGVSEELYVELVEAVVTIRAVEFDQHISELHRLIEEQPLGNASSFSDTVDALVASVRR
jgi:hypothetical protein